MTEEPVWEATALAVECLLVFLVREKSTAFRVLDGPMVVYHHRVEVAWEHHQSRVLAVDVYQGVTGGWAGGVSVGIGVGQGGVVTGTLCGDTTVPLLIAVVLGRNRPTARARDSGRTGSVVERPRHRTPGDPVGPTGFHLGY